MISEKKLEKKLNDRVKDLGGMSVKFHVVFFLGFPDRICLFKGGRIAFVEVKGTGEKPKKIQLKVHDKLTKLGFNVFVIDTLELLDSFIKKYE